ncbi:MAG: tetratricopeptide repeat protein [Anaerolineae bacterium]|nr:tetratricopeptide repeat protein [Anaerolineae bacterium]MDH7472992.1 tetratricopeptide repeat protein [Anaerolineae bacterium]
MPELRPEQEAIEEALVLETAKRYLPMGIIERVARGVEGLWGERRDVTVLFADLCDYTALSEAFDPELVYGLLNAILDVLVKEVHRFEGVVNQFRGDGLMATFGIPLTHENDPERAVRAALNMQRALLELNREVEARLGVTVKVRIGINHGQVIAGSIGSEDRRDFTVIGSTVNLAARLENAADPGTILVSKSVYQRTYRLFEFQAQPPLKLKGIFQPVENWLALGPKEQPVSVRGLEGLSARMIGRDRELAALQEAAADLMTNGRGRLILVTGEAGIGKSRLIAEFKASLTGKPITILEGACQAHTSATAYSLFTHLLNNCLQLPVETAKVRREALDTWLQGHLPQRALTIAPLLAYLLGLPITGEEEKALHILEPSQLQRQVFVAVRDLLLHIANRQATIVILEDLHWVDSASLELLVFLAPLVEQAPLIFCGISRPLSGQAAPRLKDLGATRLASKFLLIELNPLSPEETDALLADLLAIPAFSNALRRTILNRAEGNPFFLEEFIRMLVNEGYIAQEERAGESRWVAVRKVDLDSLRVPQTLQELIIARVDRLPTGPRHVLACAAVLGQNFSKTLLSELVLPEQRPGLDAHLRYLHVYDFIFPHAESTDIYTFKHVVIQETVYDSLLKEAQREYHWRAGQALERLYADRLDEHLEQLAYHYGRSGLAAKAVPYLTEAASREALRYANDEALQYYHEALTMLPHLSPDIQPDFALKIAMGRGDIYLLVGRYAEARTEYWRGLGIIHGSPRPPSEDMTTESLAMRRKIGQCYERQGDYARAMLWYQLALTDAEVKLPLSSYALEVARLYSDIGWWHFRRNELDEAETWLGKALRILEGTDHHGEVASIHNRMGGVWYQRGDLDKAAQEVSAALALYESMGDLQGMARGYANLGVLALEQNRWVEAADYFQRSLETHQRTGDMQGVTIASGNLGVVYTNLGDIPQARQFLEGSLQGALTTADSFNAAQAYKNLGRAFIYAEEWALAAEHLQKALTIYEELGDNELLADVYELLGEAALGSGDLDGAETLAQRAMEMALQSESGREEREARAWRLRGMVQREQGHLTAAMASLLQSRQMFEKQDNRLELGQAILELARLHQTLGQKEDARRLGEECQAMCQSIQASLICQRAANFLAGLNGLYRE